MVSKRPSVLGHQRPWCRPRRSPATRTGCSVAVDRSSANSPPKPPSPPSDLGPEGGGHQRLDQLDRPLAGLDVDAGRRVGGRAPECSGRVERGWSGVGSRDDPASRPGPAGRAAQCRPIAELDTGDRHRVVAGQAGVAEPGTRGVDRLHQVVEGQVLERVDVEELDDLVDGS